MSKPPLFFIVIIGLIIVAAGTSMRYEASFKPQSGGMEQTFRLDAQQYHALTVGDKGTLSYKGTRFVSFVGEQ